MTKKILLSTVAAATLLASTASGLTLEERIAKLEKIIASQQKTIKTLSSKPASNDTVNEDIEDLDERLEAIETRSYTDKIQLGLGMRVEANNISTTYANDTSPTKEDIIWRTKLNINMKSKIADNLKFTGRLSMYKNWGDSSTNKTAYATIDSRQGRTPDNSSAVYVERAYLDWTLNPDSTVPVIVTLGRQPSSDGPSYQIKEGMSRKGTYDALAFDGAADGVVFTANFDKVMKNTSARIAYGTPNNGSNNGSATSTVVDTKVTGLFIDSAIPGIGNQNLIQAYYVAAKDFNADASGQSGANDTIVGDFDLTGLMFEVSGLNGFDFFAHYAYSKAKPNGNSMDASGTGAGPYYGLLSTNSATTGGDTTSKSGHAYWLGARYNISKIWSIGAEYNKGSKNWFSFTYSPSDPLNKLAARGSATEIYTTYAINKNANIRAGFVDVKYDYTGSGSHLGGPMAITSALGTNAVKEKKNAYVTFNVLF